MLSNTLNVLSNISNRKVVSLLQKMAEYQLSAPQAKNVESVISQFNGELTILDVVKACENIEDLREFALKVGAYCLPGSGYKEIFECEFDEKIV
jgi:hypothetical protein